MTSQETAELLAEVQALIREREREGVVGLAERIAPPSGRTSSPSSSRARWPSCSSGCRTRRSPPSSRSCRRPRRPGSCAPWRLPEAAQLLEEMDPDDAADVVEQLPSARRGRDPGPDEAERGRRDPGAVGLRARHGRRDHDARLRGGLAGRDRRGGDRRDPPPRRRGRDGQLRLRRRRGAPPARRAVAVPPAPEPRRRRRSWS